MEAKAVFGGGCFWCTEAVFKMIRGVSAIRSGYAGGTALNPTYEAVCSGSTGHAEVIEVTYDPSIISYRELLTIFFASHDPTTLNRQGADVGTQYRSIILPSTDEEERIAREMITDINISAKRGAPVVTEVKRLDVFYPAESYHQDYYARNPDNRYCELVINPKLEKVQKEFASLLQTHHL